MPIVHAALMCFGLAPPLVERGAIPWPCLTSYLHDASSRTRALRKERFWSVAGEPFLPLMTSAQPFLLVVPSLSALAACFFTLPLTREYYCATIEDGALILHSPRTDSGANDDFMISAV